MWWHFDPAMVEGLPEPARRWLCHVIAPGAPLAPGVVLAMQGRLRLKGWIPFRAIQVEVPAEGYVWAARARLGPLAISGFDRYAGHAGEMHWKLAGRVAVMNAAGPDVSRSAAGRLALDTVFVPTAYLSPAVVWAGVPGNANAVQATWTIDGEEHPLELRIDARGGLVSVTAPRWSNPAGEPWGYHVCGGALEREAEFGGITIPTMLRVGYFFGTDRWARGEFFRARITGATYL